MPPRTESAARFAFFFYGTLCDSDVRHTVLGRAAAAQAAVLADYEAVPAERGRFPILLFQPGREAAGVVCDGVTVEEAARLGFYEHEGRDYTARRLSVRVLPTQGDSSTVGKAWLFLPTAALRRGPGRWDLAEWQRFAKRDFLARVRVAMSKVDPELLAPHQALWRGRAGRGGR